MLKSQFLLERINCQERVFFRLVRDIVAFSDYSYRRFLISYLSGIPDYQFLPYLALL